MSIPNQPNIKLTNTSDYRESYANSVQVRVNVWDFFLVFGTLQQQSETPGGGQYFQGIYLSPQQAKALSGHPAAKRGRLRKHVRRDQAGSAYDDSRAGALSGRWISLSS